MVYKRTICIPGLYQVIMQIVNLTICLHLDFIFLKDFIVVISQINQNIID